MIAIGCIRSGVWSIGSFSAVRCVIGGIIIMTGSRGDSGL
jgi:hypothetical protein